MCNGLVALVLRRNLTSTVTGRMTSMPHQDMDHHQKLQAPCMIVKTVKVTPQDDEQLWLLNECGLRPCFTWNDGYSGYRCLAAIRDTTMTLVIQDKTPCMPY